MNRESFRDGYFCSWRGKNERRGFKTTPSLARPLTEGHAAARSCMMELTLKRALQCSAIRRQVWNGDTLVSAIFQIFSTLQRAPIKFQRIHSPLVAEDASSLWATKC